MDFLVRTFEESNGPDRRRSSSEIRHILITKLTINNVLLNQSGHLHREFPKVDRLNGAVFDDKELLLALVRNEEGSEVLCIGVYVKA